MSSPDSYTSSQALHDALFDEDIAGEVQMAKDSEALQEEQEETLCDARGYATLDLKHLTHLVRKQDEKDGMKPKLWKLDQQRIDDHGELWEAQQAVCARPHASRARGLSHPVPVPVPVSPGLTGLVWSHPVSPGFPGCRLNLH